VLTVLQLALAALLLALLFTRIPWADEIAPGGARVPGLRSQLARISAGSFLLATGLACAWTLAMSVRWRLLTGVLGLSLTLGRAVRLNLAGHAASQVLLGSVGGDLLRGALVAQGGASLAGRTQLVFAMIMDRLIGLAALLAIGVAAASAEPWARAEFGLWLGIALAALLVSLWIAFRLGAGAGTADDASALRRMAHSVRAALVSYRSHPGALAAAFLLSLVSHLALMLAVASIGRSLGIEVPLSRYLVLQPIIESVQAIPISPGGWGVAETLFVGLYGRAGVDATAALSLALGARAVRLTQALLGVLALIPTSRAR
jgi:hypothetical protein